MHKIRFVLSLLMLLIALLPMASGQERITTEARDFWVMFFPNGDNTQVSTLRLTAVGDTACTVTVTNPMSSWSVSESMNASSSVNITIPNTAIHDAINSSGNYAFHVTSTAAVSLIASHTKESSCAAALILPTAALGRRYVVLDYPTDPTRTDISGAAVGFVAIDTTNLSMTLTCDISGHAAGSVLNITIAPGQSYLLKCNSANGSFSGMEVIGDHPFAMFQGNIVSCVPHNSTQSLDCMYEQAVPVEQWGNDYAVVASKGRSVGDRVRCVNMVVNGTGDTTYSVNETDLPANSTSRIQAEHPFSVGFCTRGSNWNGEYGDPSFFHGGKTKREGRYFQGPEKNVRG